MATATKLGGSSKRTPRRMARPENEADTTTWRGRVGARIRSLRKAKNLSVTEFAQAVSAAGYDIGEPTVYAWENGRTQPPLDALPAIAKVLGVSKPRNVLPG